MKDESVIEIRNLWVNYETTVALKGVDLTVRKGDIFGIIGPNGGGKSTLLKAILGLVPPTQGSIHILGEPPEQGRRHIGYVPQFAQFDREFPISVLDVVVMGFLSRKTRVSWYTKEDRIAAQDALKFVGMLKLADQHISSLSGGQKQRVFIARALASKPEILLLDEPTASVDQNIKESIYDLLSRIQKSMTVVLVTHDIGVVSSLVNRVACLNQTLFTHYDNKLTAQMLEDAYRCPVDLIAHGVPHRVFEPHDHKSHDPGGG
jgi:zinc transport system ATP-binding protein